MAKHEGRRELLPSVLLTTDSKYGFRNETTELGVSLIRATIDPDPTPEFGMHHFRIGVGVVSQPDYDACLRLATQFAHPCPSASIPLGDSKREKSLPLSSAFCRVEGQNVALSAIKPSEDGSGIVVRVYNAAPQETTCQLYFRIRPKGAYVCDLNETTCTPIAFTGKTLTLTLPPHGIRSVKLLAE